MFDIAFTEMIIIFVVLLLVVGPNRLPGLVRTIGFWMGRARRVVNDIQTDMEREANRIDALKQSVEQPMTKLKKAVSEIATEPTTAPETAVDTAPTAATPSVGLSSTKEHEDLVVPNDHSNHDHSSHEPADTAPVSELKPAAKKATATPADSTI